MDSSIEDIDIGTLQLITVNNRPMYTKYLETVFTKCSKLRIKALEIECVNQKEPDTPNFRQLDLSVHNAHLNIQNNLEIDVKNALKEQIHSLIILNKKRNCPISRKMDQL